MSTSGSEEVTLEEFRVLTDRAGLGIGQDELEELKPLYEQYLEHAKKLRSIDLKAEEMAVDFHADGPAP